jgi:hypothetical protein
LSPVIHATFLLRYTYPQTRIERRRPTVAAVEGSTI